MADRFSTDPTSCLRILFGPQHGQELAKVPWREFADASRDQEHPLVRTWNDHDRAKLFALVRLCECYYPYQHHEPEKLLCVGDVVHRFSPRVRGLRLRTIWLTCLDATDCVIDEALLQIGASPVAVPPLRTFLRQAIIKEAVSVYVVDFRPVDELIPYRSTVKALADLTTLGLAAQILVKDWVLIGPNGACSVRERVAEVREAPALTSEAA
ncbi:MAG: JAB domain-containing protein [Pseudomonadota bacterium]|nr:JAB domain-containing protein [Pseudomonadota bacterium]